MNYDHLRALLTGEMQVRVPDWRQTVSFDSFMASLGIAAKANPAVHSSPEVEKRCLYCHPEALVGRWAAKPFEGGLGLTQEQIISRVRRAKGEE